MQPVVSEFLSFNRGKQWAICLLAVWFLLNAVDLMSTYQALSTGRAAEMNPLMGLLLGMPVLAITAKMLLAYAAAKIVEQMDSRNSYYSILTLLILDIYLAMVCANNVRVFLSA